MALPEMQLTAKCEEHYGHLVGITDGNYSVVLVDAGLPAASGMWTLISSATKHAYRPKVKNVLGFADVPPLK